jgi:hypothetical protein
MQNFNTRVYSISDFLEWHNTGYLNISPEFQRRGVWSSQAKSYLIDTVITGKPMPKVLMTQNLRDARNKIIIDGQQRLRSIIEYCSDQFAIYESHNEEYGGVLFSDLPREIQSNILNYSIGVDLLYDLSYEQTLDIFARLNTYTVRLNAQELRNAEFSGPFKQISYKIGYAYVGYWEESGMFTKQKVVRMAEAELASDLLIVAVGGIEPKKLITSYYRNFNSESNELNSSRDKVVEAMDLIISVYPPEDLKETIYRQPHLFYSLFCAFYHSMFEIPGFDGKRNPGLKNETKRVKEKLDQYSDLYKKADQSLEDFIFASKKTANSKAHRILRAEKLCDQVTG